MKENLNSVNPEDVSLKELILQTKSWLLYLLSKWIFLLVFASIGALSGFIYAYFSDINYRAKLTFVYGESGNSQMSGLSSLASQFGLAGGSSSNSMFDGQNLLEFMQSRTIIQEVLLNKVVFENKKQTLAKCYIDIYKLRDIWRDKAPKLADVSFEQIPEGTELSLEQNIILGNLYSVIKSRQLKVGRSEKESSIMSIDFLSENEIFSMAFVDELASVVTKYYIKTKTKNAADNVAILQHQTDSVRVALNRAIRGVAESSDFNPNPNPARKILLVPSQSRQVDVQANQAILTQLVQNLELAKLSLRNQMPLIQVIDRPILPLDVVKTSVIVSVILGALCGVIFLIVYFSMRLVLKNILQ